MRLKTIKYLAFVLWAFPLSVSALDSFNFPSFGTTDLYLNQDGTCPTVTGNKLRMTCVGEFHKRLFAYYNPTATNIYNRTPDANDGNVQFDTLKAFTTSFSFQVLNPNDNPLVGGDPSTNHGGDGFTFVIHREPDRLGGRGGGGGDLGIKSMRNVVGVEFDFFCNGGFETCPASGIAPDHIAIDSSLPQSGESDGFNRGDVNHGNDTGVGTTVAYGSTHGFDFVTGTPTNYAWIDYDGTTLEVRFNQTGVRPAVALLSYDINIDTALKATPADLVNPNNNKAYVGFTAGTGSSTSNIDILSWDFTALPDPVSQTPVQSLTHSIAVYDPSNNNLKAIPENEIVVSTDYINEGDPPDSGTLVITVPVNPNTSFKVGSVTFTDDAGANASGMTIGTVEYSSTDPSVTWTDYTPVGGVGSYDSSVRGIRITPAGTMNTGTAITPIGFITTYQAKIN